jgi:hypothetical protein
LNYVELLSGKNGWRAHKQSSGYRKNYFLLQHGSITHD